LLLSTVADYIEMSANDGFVGWPVKRHVIADSRDET